MNHDSDSPTGEMQTSTQVVRTVTYPIGPFELLVQLGEGDKFLGISEVRIQKDFLTLSQRVGNIQYHDVEDLYRK